MAASFAASVIVSGSTATVAGTLAGIAVRGFDSLNHSTLPPACDAVLIDGLVAARLDRHRDVTQGKAAPLLKIDP
jgi:hypothetical protein